MTLDSDNMTKNITYTPSETTGVVYFSEAEHIDGLTLTTNGNTAIRSSNGASAYAKDADVVFTNLPNGKYQIGAVFCDASKANSTWSFKAGNNVVFEHTVSVVNWDEGLSPEFELNYASTPIALVQGGSSALGVDLIYIVKTGEADLIKQSEPRVWNFEQMSEADKALLTADTEHWTDSKGRMQNSGVAFDNEVITVNGTELETTKGLLFKADASKLLLGYADGANPYMQVQKGASFTITDLAVGDTVRMVVNTAGKDARSIAQPDPSVAKIVEGGYPVTSKHTCTLVMMQAGNLTLAGTHDLRFYNLETKPGELPVATPGVKNIAEFKALEPGTEARLVLNNAKITYMGGELPAVNLYMEDESGAIMFDNMMSGVMVQMGYTPGMAANGYITAVASVEADGTPCLSIGQNVADFHVNEPVTVEIVPTELALGDVADDANISKLVTVTNVDLSLNSENQIVAANGDAEVIVSEKFINVETENGTLPAKLTSLTAIVAKVNGVYQLCATAFVDASADAINSVDAETVGRTADVYTIGGTKVRKAGESLNGLAKGLYIVGDKKIVVK